MTDDMMNLRALLEQSPDADLLYPSGVGRLPRMAYICESRFVNVELRG
jgi:hypothetical protein